MKTEWTDKDYAVAALDMLPDTIEGIAEMLRKHRIRGGSYAPDTCPIAQWVTKWTGTRISIGRTFGYFPYGSFRGESFPYPIAVQRFIINYDEGIIDV